MSKHFSSITELCCGFFRGDRWEAPERGFIGHRDILVQSRARYEFVAPYVRGKLLDLGCGRGYGFEVLVPQSDEQVGIDVSFMFLAQARRLFPGISLVCGKGDALPIANSSFDSILAFEVIEHAENDQSFLDELRRVARQDALVAVSTPNRIVSSGDSQKPLNRFHHREYTPDEFNHLLRDKFSSVELFGQHERSDTESSRNRFINGIPIRWKYLLPHAVQTLMSVALRPPLRLEECRFQTTNLERAQTLLALCRL